MVQTHMKHVTVGKGAPDLLGVLKPSGRIFGLELKAPKGKLREEQKAWADACRASGGFCGSARTIEEAQAALARALDGASQ